MSTVTGDDIIAEAREWIGTPYHHAQALKQVGCDCIGLVRGVGAVLGLPEAAAFAADVRFAGYTRPPNPRLLGAACDTYLDRIAKSQARVGDIFLGRVEKEPQHFGFISSLSPMRIIHSYAQLGCVVENIVDDAWLSKLLRVYRVKGLV